MQWVSGDYYTLDEYWPPSLEALIERLNRHNDAKAVLRYYIPCADILGRTYYDDMVKLSKYVLNNVRIESICFVTKPSTVQTTMHELAESMFAFLSWGEIIYKEKFDGLHISDPPTLSSEARKVIAVAETDRDSILDAVVEGLSTGATRIEIGQGDILILMGEFDTFIGPVHVMSRSIDDIVGGIIPEDDKKDVPVDNPLPPTQRKAKTLMALNMREAPDSGAKKVVVVPKGATIEVRDPQDVQNYYTYVGYENSGIVYAGYIATVVSGRDALEYENE